MKALSSFIAASEHPLANDFEYREALDRFTTQPVVERGLILMQFTPGDHHRHVTVGSPRARHGSTLPKASVAALRIEDRSSQIEVQSKRDVELLLEVEGESPQPITDSAYRYGTDLLGLGFGVDLQSCDTCVE